MVKNDTLIFDGRLLDTDIFITETANIEFVDGLFCITTTSTSSRLVLTPYVIQRIFEIAKRNYWLSRNEPDLCYVLGKDK
jgi:hypothetical protein